MKCAEDSMKNPLHNFKYKQVIVIRKDIEMTPAKLGVQVAHGAIESYIRTPLPIQDEWHLEGMRKIVLMVQSLDDLKNLMRASKDATYIIDFGLTELEPNTVTGLAFPIMLEEDINKITKHLKLYR
jgi:peptidyl-tRNA hydrolase, PTH2 family